MKALWIRVEAHEVDSKLVDQLATSLGVPDAHALGLYVALGGAVAEHAPEGRISDVSDAKLEVWAHWSGKRGQFAAAARAMLQTSDGMLVDWEDSMGQLVERRKRDLARKGSGNSTEIPRKGSGNSTATERNGTERDVTGRSADSALEQSSTSRNGSVPGESSRARNEPGAAPLADATECELPEDALRFLAHFYHRGLADAKRRRDVYNQVVATIAPNVVGARLRAGEYVRALTPQRLAAKCREVVREGVDKADAAIVVLLKKLADTTTVTEGQVREEEIQRTQEVLEGRRTLAQAEAWLAAQPDDVHAELRRELGDQPDLERTDGVSRIDEVLWVFRRTELVLELWQRAGAPDPEAAHA